MNETKIEILKCLSGGDWWATTEVAQWCGLRLTNASELLRRYRGQGLVVRERNPKVPRGYLYRITVVGLGRLRYFTSDVMQSSSIVSTHIGLTGKKKQVFNQWFANKLGGN